jgi:hypothetical protein
MSRIFLFNQGHSVKGLSPQVIGETLEEIRQRNNGVLKAEVVLEEASAEDHALHNGFTWDDSAAAHKHRLNEARRLITSVRVVNGTTQKPIRAFINVRTAEHGRCYTDSIEAMSDDELRTRIMVEARQMIESLERRYSHLVEVGDILDRLKKSVA